MDLMLIDLLESSKAIGLCPMGTVKPVWIGHAKIDKTKVLKTNGSFMKVKPVLSDIRSRKPIFGLLFEWPRKTGFTVLYTNFCYVLSARVCQVHTLADTVDGVLYGV